MEKTVEKHKENNIALRLLGIIASSIINFGLVIISMLYVVNNVTENKMNAEETVDISNGMFLLCLRKELVTF